MDASTVEAVATAISAFFAALAAWLAYLAFKENRKNTENADYRETNANSAKFALYYAEEILPRARFVVGCVRNTKTFQRISPAFELNGSGPGNLRGFDVPSFKSVIGTEPQQIWSGIRDDICSMSEDGEQWAAVRLRYEQLLETISSLKKDDFLKSMDTLDASETNTEEHSAAFKRACKTLSAELEKTTVELANRLEYLAIALNTEVAHEETLYPSLHQTFFDTIETIYPRICLINSTMHRDQYYTHIVVLYELWSKRYTHILQKEEDDIQSLIESTTKVGWQKNN